MLGRTRLNSIATALRVTGPPSCEPPPSLRARLDASVPRSFAAPAFSHRRIRLVLERAPRVSATTGGPFAHLDAVARSDASGCLVPSSANALKSRAHGKRSWSCYRQWFARLVLTCNLERSLRLTKLRGPRNDAPLADRPSHPAAAEPRLRWSGTTLRDSEPLNHHAFPSLFPPDHGRLAARRLRCSKSDCASPYCYRARREGAVRRNPGLP